MTRSTFVVASVLGTLALGPLATAACSSTAPEPRAIHRPAGPPAGARSEVKAAAGSLRVPVLLYHHVGPVRGTWKNLYVGLPSFSRQMRELAASGVEMLTIDELYEAVRTGRSFPEGAVAITFDDATADQYTLAFPVMLQYKIRATFFVPAGLVGRPGYLTWRQLGEMRASGLVAIEAHTVTHPDLTKLELEHARREIADGRALLERKLGIRVRHFAYPYGTYTDRVLLLVREAGFRSALTTRYRPDHRAAEALEWGRMGVHDRYLPGNLVSLARAGGTRRS